MEGFSQFIDHIDNFFYALAAFLAGISQVVKAVYTGKEHRAKQRKRLKALE